MTKGMMLQLMLSTRKGDYWIREIDDRYRTVKVKNTPPPINIDLATWFVIRFLCKEHVGLLVILGRESLGGTEEFYK